MDRRTVRTIKDTLEPKEIYELIVGKSWDYSDLWKEEYVCRDRAGMALAFVSAGRVSEIFGGKRFEREVLDRELVDGKWKTTKFRLNEIGRHEGLKREHLEVTDKFMFVDGMPIVKRTRRIIKKYGPQVAIRDRFVVPLRKELFENQFYDQLVPFGWLIIEYLERYAPKHGKLFPFQDCRAWQIIKHCTGMFPNWFRAQADRFYGYFITRDSVKHSKFIGRVHAESSMPYVRYTWSDDLKDKSLAMDFEWIDLAVEEIKARI